MRSLSPQPLRQFQLLPGPAFQRQHPQGLSCPEIRRCSQLPGRMPKQPPLHGHSQLPKPAHLNGKPIAARASAAPHRLPGQQQLRSKPAQLALPPRLLIPRQLRHLRHVFPQPRIPTLQHRQQLMPDPVPRKRQMLVRRVLAPPLPQLPEIGLNLGPRRSQQRPQNPPLGKLHHWMNPAQPLRPRTAQKLRQHRLRLVVQRVRSSHSIHRPRRHQLSEPPVAHPSPSLFQRLDLFALGSPRLRR